jgi:predicted nucleic acid-binding protein
MTAVVFVDTNVLVYRRDRADEDKNEKALEWIEYLWRAHLGRLSVQVLHEFYVTVTQKLDPKLPKETARQDVRDFASWRPVISDTKLIEDAWSIQDRFKTSWWNSHIIAAAQSAGCRYLLSEDFQHNQAFDHLEVVNPFLRSPASVFHQEA